jgi:hypothetical protein
MGMETLPAIQVVHLEEQTFWDFLWLHRRIYVYTNNLFGYSVLV